MAKILHAADIHLGMENYGTVDKETGLHSRLLDFLNSLDYAIEYGINENIDFFIFAGDAFKTREPTQTQQREFAKRIKRVASEGIPVILIIGNHDMPNATGKADTLNIYKTLDVENVYVCSEPEVLKFEKDSYDVWTLVDDDSIGTESKDIFQIAALPWITKSSLMSKDDYKERSIDDVYKYMTDEVVAKINDLASQINKKYPSLLAIHGTIAGAEFGAERKVYIGSDIVIPMQQLVEPWGYVALGHLHKYQVLNENPPVIYSGSIDRVDFSEEKEAKGFVMANVKTLNTDYEFIEVPARRFVLLNVEIADGDLDPMKSVLKAVAKNNFKDAIVKMIIRIPENIASLIDNKEIIKSLSKAYYFAGIKKEIIKSQKDNTEIENIEAISPMEALKKYLESRGAKKDKVKKYQEYAEKIIKSLEE